MIEFIAGLVVGGLAGTLFGFFLVMGAFTLMGGGERAGDE